MDSDDVRERLRKQRERWLRERDIDKERKEVETEIRQTHHQPLSM
jgi:hypothetical protein